MNNEKELRTTQDLHCESKLSTLLFSKPTLRVRDLTSGSFIERHILKYEKIEGIGEIFSYYELNIKGILDNILFVI